jgi:CheY-like chemotaxis protein
MGGDKQTESPVGQQSSPDLSLVLVVDDDEEVLQLTADVLKTLGYRVLKARTGLEAVEQLERNTEISVLFTDVRMPDIAGEGLAGIATTWRPDIRVVLTSDSGRPHGDSEFLPKPYRATDLIRVFPPQPLPTLGSDCEANRSD